MTRDFACRKIAPTAISRSSGHYRPRSRYFSSSSSSEFFFPIVWIFYPSADPLGIFPSEASIKGVAIRNSATRSSAFPHMNKTTRFNIYFVVTWMPELRTPKTPGFWCVLRLERPYKRKLSTTAKIYESQTIRAAADDGASLIARGKNIANS